APTATMLRIMQGDADSIESIVADLPEGLAAIVGKGLQKDAAARYQTAEEFGADLQLLRTSLAEAGGADAGSPRTQITRTRISPPVTSDQPAKRQQTRPMAVTAVAGSRQRGWVLGAIAAVVLLAGLAWFSATRSSSSTGTD